MHHVPFYPTLPSPYNPMTISFVSHLLDVFYSTAVLKNRKKTYEKETHRQVQAEKGDWGLLSRVSNSYINLSSRGHTQGVQ